MYPEVIPPSMTKPRTQSASIPASQALSTIVKMSLNMTTLLALGAVLQACLVLLPIPKYYAVAPAVIYLLLRLAETALITTGVIANPQLKGVIPFKFSALMPDVNGNLPSKEELPSKERVAVFLLCAKVNHPLGFLGAPEVKKFGQLGQKMYKELSTLPQSETGFIGQAQAYMPSTSGAPEILNISYWRSAAHVIKYAESPLHKEAIKWWNDMGGFDGKGGKVPHIGIMHELYESGPGMWETLYSGYQPTLMSGLSFPRGGQKLDNGMVPEEWISPVVEARRGKLAKSTGRVGPEINEEAAQLSVPGMKGY